MSLGPRPGSQYHLPRGGVPTRPQADPLLLGLVVRLGGMRRVLLDVGDLGTRSATTRMRPTALGPIAPAVHRTPSRARWLRGARTRKPRLTLSVSVATWRAIASWRTLLPEGLPLAWRTRLPGALL